MDISNKRQIIYVIGVLLLLIIFTFVYKKIQKHEKFIILSEIQDLSTNKEIALLHSPTQVKFVNSNIGNYFTGASGGNTLTDIITDIYSKVNANITNNKADATNITVNTANISNLQTSNTAVWGIANQALTLANNLSPLPVGTIIAWNKTTLPDATWQLCDGASYSYMDSGGVIQNITTPYLRGRFILGSSPSHTLGDLGGEETHKLTVPELPLHFHHIFTGANDYNPFAPDNPTPAENWRERIQCWNYPGQGDVEASITGAGGYKPHNNMPPFYVLTYIIKVFKNVAQASAPDTTHTPHPIQIATGFQIDRAPPPGIDGGWARASYSIGGYDAFCRTVGDEPKQFFSCVFYDDIAISNQYATREEDPHSSKYSTAPKTYSLKANSNLQVPAQGTLARTVYDSINAPDSIY